MPAACPSRTAHVFQRACGDDVFWRACGDDVFWRACGDDVSWRACGDDVSWRACGDDVPKCPSGDDVFWRACGDDVPKCPSGDYPGRAAGPASHTQPTRAKAPLASPHAAIARPAAAAEAQGDPTALPDAGLPG